MGKNAVTTFYYVARERFNLPKVDFERKPSEILQHLEEMLGPGAYHRVDGSMAVQVKEIFGSGEKAAHLANHRSC